MGQMQKPLGLTKVGGSAAGADHACRHHIVASPFHHPQAKCSKAHHWGHLGVEGWQLWQRSGDAALHSMREEWGGGGESTCVLEGPGDQTHFGFVVAEVVMCDE